MNIMAPPTDRIHRSPRRALQAWRSVCRTWPTDGGRGVYLRIGHHTSPAGMPADLEVDVVAGDHGADPVIELSTLSWQNLDGRGEVKTWGPALRLSAAESLRLIGVLTAAHDLAEAGATS